MNQKSDAPHSRTGAAAAQPKIAERKPAAHVQAALAAAAQPKMAAVPRATTPPRIAPPPLPPPRSAGAATAQSRPPAVPPPAVRAVPVPAPVPAVSLPPRPAAPAGRPAPPGPQPVHPLPAGNTLQLMKRKSTLDAPKGNKKLHVENSIASRVRDRNSASRFKSERLRNKIVKPRKTKKKGGGRVQYYEPRERGIWNGKSRPPWDGETWDALWARGNSKTDTNGRRLYVCEHCGEEVYRKSDKATKNDATIDHKIQFATYVWDNAVPNSSGKITSEAAREASNDLDNLQLLCRSCNSKKNGKRNLFD